MIPKFVHRRWWLIATAALIAGCLLVVSKAFPLYPPWAPLTLTGEFTLGRQAGSVSAHVLERDFHSRLTRSSFFGTKTVTCRDDLGVSVGSTAHCDAQLGKNWKTGSPQAVRTSSGWLADRADYAVTHVDGRRIRYVITPGLSAVMLEKVLARDLITASYLQCPENGIAGVAGTTVSCHTNYADPDRRCSNPIFDEQGRESAFIRRCTLLVEVRNVSGLSLDLKVLKVTPPA